MLALGYKCLGCGGIGTKDGRIDSCATCGRVPSNFVECTAGVFCPNKKAERHH